MSSPLRIPPRYLSGLQAAAVMSDEEERRLIGALEHVPSRLTTDRLVAAVVKAAPDLTDRAAEILRALMSLVGLLPEGDARLKDLAESVAESEDLELDEAQREAFVQRLDRILRLDALVLASRAHDVAVDHEHVFHDARVLTDLRPVFGSEPADGPKAMSIVSVLKVEFHASHGELDASYFALDHGDLIALRDVLDRALAKTESTKSLVDRMKLPYWEYEELPDAAGT